MLGRLTGRNIALLHYTHPFTHPNQTNKYNETPRGTVSGVQRLGHTANRGVATVSRYLGRTSVARAAAATFAEVRVYCIVSYTCGPVLPVCSWV